MSNFFRMKVVLRFVFSLTLLSFGKRYTWEKVNVLIIITTANIVENILLPLSTLLALTMAPAEGRNVRNNIFSTPKFVAQKLGYPHLKKPLLLVRKISAMNKSPSPECRRLLWTVPLRNVKFRLFLEATVVLLFSFHLGSCTKVA